MKENNLGKMIREFARMPVWNCDSKGAIVKNLNVHLMFFNQKMSAKSIIITIRILSAHLKKIEEMDKKMMELIDKLEEKLGEKK